MVSALDFGTSSPGSSPGQGHFLCYWRTHFTLTVPLSTLVYKWVSAEVHNTNAGNFLCPLYVCLFVNS